MQLHSHPQPRKMIQTPGEVLIIYEANDGMRQIFTDGRRDTGWLDEEGAVITTAGKLINDSAG
jgi:hypothetical protein